MSDNAPYIVFYALAAVLVASSLFSRRIPLGTAAKMGLAWVGIFAIAFGIFAFRSELSGLGQRLTAEATGSSVVEGETVRIPINEDGHFWVKAQLNGHDARLMVDSGASVTTISADTAAAAGVPVSRRRAMVSTANGKILVSQGEVRRLNVGTIEFDDFPIDVSDSDDVNVLGMNFLSKLRSWRVEGNYLVLVP